MDRYRNPTSPPLDDNTLTEGDVSLMGVNSYDSSENLQPGQCQAAVNMDFTTQDAATRGGFVCLPALGATQFGDLTWTQRTSAADVSWFGVAFGNNMFVAVSDASGNNVMTSPDGIVWTTRSSGLIDSWRAITFGNGVFVAVSSGGSVMTSEDGIAWDSQISAGPNAWLCITYGNGVFVALADEGGPGGSAAMTSPDGVTWTLHSTPSNAWNSVVYGNGLFVAVGFDTAFNQVIASPDGATWTAHSAASADTWVSVTYGNGLFVAVSQSGSGNRVMTSANGAAWTSRASAADLFWSAVAFGNNNFVAVAFAGDGGQSMISTDGITWTLLATAANNQWFGLVYGMYKFVAVAVSGIGSRVMTAQKTVYASAIYSDPNDPGSQWIMLVGASSVGFYAFGRTARSVSYASGQTVSQQSTIVQCNNQVYIFRGATQTPLYWDGNWGGMFTLAPTPAPPGPGFQIIPDSNQATFYQNRLWVIQGKDDVAASDVLDFTAFDLLANDFNLNTGDSDFLVTTYPFGTTTLVVFKNKSIIALTAVDGALTDVVATEITRQLGSIGINSVCSVGSDLVYMSDRNINLLSLTATSNALQHQTLPLSTNLRSIMNRVNWNYGSKVSMAYWDNKLYVALPLDNATVCNVVVVYNFITQQWFGEWNFAAELGMAIQGWAVATYLGATRLHCVTEDGRILVTNEGQNDISGTTVAEIAASLTSRAYVMNNENRFTRRLYLDLATNRPDFSVTAYVEGASESTQELTDQTYLRSQSWLFSDSAYDLTNANDDYNRAYRKDYSTGPASVQSGTGFLPEMDQEFRLPLITRRNGRLQWLKVTNSTGKIRVNGVGFEARAGYRSSLIQVG